MSHPGGFRHFENSLDRLERNDPTLYYLSVGFDIQIKRNATRFADAINGNSHLKEILFNGIQDVSAFEIALKSLSNSAVTKVGLYPGANLISEFHIDPIRLNLTACKIGVHLNNIASLKKLDLKGCSLTPSSARSLSAALSSNKTLIEVDLGRNNIGDEGAVAFAGALKTNNTLKSLILDKNGISPYGQHALRKSIYDDSTFASIKSSNHTIESFFSLPRSVFGRPAMGDVLFSLAANMRSHWPESAATKKMSRVLSKKYNFNFSLDSFFEMDTKLMPLALSWVGNQCDLNAVFDIIKHMPHLATRDVVQMNLLKTNENNTFGLVLLKIVGLPDDDVLTPMH